MSSKLMGIDVGTSSIKVGLLDEASGLIDFEQQGYNVETPHNGWVQIRADVLWSSLLACLARMAQRHSFADVVGIGFSCMSPGLVGFDAAGDVVVDPILYSDRRSDKEAAWLRREIGADHMFSITGNNVMAGAISVTSMLWVKRNAPDVYARVRTFGHLNTLMGYRMTGKMALDRCNASYTGLFDTVHTRDWSDELCRRAGVDRALLPAILDSQDIVGRLNAAEVIGLGVPAGIPVVIGGADSPCASLACGVIRAGDICQSVGTTNVLTICIDKPVFSKAYLNRCHVIPGVWIYQGATSNGGLVVKWAREVFSKDLEEVGRETGRNVFELMHEEAARSCAGANGVVFLPYLAGERCPVWDAKAKGVFFGLHQENTREDMLRAVLESVCYSTRQLLEIAEATSGRTYDQIDTVGGGAKSRIWTQMKADVLGRTMRMMELPEAAVVGAAMLAGMGAGIFSTADEALALSRRTAAAVAPAATQEEKAVYEERYKTYTTLYDRLRDLF